MCQRSPARRQRKDTTQRRVVSFRHPRYPIVLTYSSSVLKSPSGSPCAHALSSSPNASDGSCQLRNGIDRSLGDADNGWWGGVGDWVEYRFAAPTHIAQARFTFDSNLKSVKRMPCSYPAKGNHVQIPAMMTRSFDIEALDEGGQWVRVAQVRNNYQRLVRGPDRLLLRLFL